MDFSWSAQQHELFQQALHFATAALNTGMREREREQGFDHSAWRALGRFGATGLCVPETYGGLGLDALTTARVLEALGNGSADLGLLFAVSAHLFACAMPIVEHGSDHLKAGSPNRPGLPFLPVHEMRRWLERKLPYSLSEKDSRLSPTLLPMAH